MNRECSSMKTDLASTFIQLSTPDAEGEFNPVDLGSLRGAGYRKIEHSLGPLRVDSGLSLISKGDASLGGIVFRPPHHGQ